MEDVMDILQITRQGIIINTFVKFHIYIHTYIHIHIMKQKLTTKSMLNER